MSARVFSSIKHVFVTFFSDNPLNTDTPLIRTLGQVPLVSVLTGFHCTFFFFQKGGYFKLSSQSNFTSALVAVYTLLTFRNKALNKNVHVFVTQKLSLS